MRRFLAAFLFACFVATPLAAPAKKPKATPPPAGALSTTVPSCPAADPAVWVNTKSKIYWAQGTEYYGKTKHGGYACTSAAVAMGSRAAKAESTKGGAMDAATPEPVASPMGKKHKKKKGDAAMSAATPAP